MSDDRDQSPAGEPAPPAHDYLETQRRALRALLNLSADAVTPVASEIEETHRRARAAAEEKLAQSTLEIETRLEEGRQAAEQAHAEQITRIESEHAAARDALASETAESLERAAAEFREIEKEACRQRDDDVLIAETIPQATIRGLRNEFRAVEHQVQAGRRRLESLRGRADRLLREYGHEPETGDTETPDTPGAPYDRLVRVAEQHLQALRALPVPRLFVGLRPYALLGLLCALPVGALGVLALLRVPYAPPFFVSGPVALAVTLVAAVLAGRTLRRKAHAQIRVEYAPLRRALTAAGRALDQRLKRAEEQLRRDEAKALEKRDRDLTAARRLFETTIAAAEQQRAESTRRSEDRRATRQAEIERARADALRQADEAKQRRLRDLQDRHDRDLAAARERHERQISACRRRHDSARAALEARWQTDLAHLRQLLDETDRLDAQPRFDWHTSSPSGWKPPDDFAELIPFGRWHADLARVAACVRARAPFLADRPPALSMPALLTLPSRCALFLQTERAGRPEAVDALRAVMLRLLTSLPPGRVRFTIIDPVGLGESFAGFMHLVDYEEALIGGRIWTESEQIEARLAELTSHMETVIQKYLRNEFESIDAYNRQAGELAEPYRFLVIADFPAGFNEGALRRLTSIVNSGARCGVFTLIAHDRRLPAPAELRVEDLVSAGIHLVHEDGRFVFQDELLSRFPLTLDTPPPEALLTRIMHEVGRRAKDSLRVEVPFASIAPGAEQYWSGDSRVDISVPIGHTGAVRLQHLRLGRGVAQHALIAGKTGSGKSTLLHVLITNLALWYSPEELELYLVDFKKGVEFKTYVTHQLPHARAIAIESDREFGISVLQRLDAEMARRGDLFRAAGVQDLPAYRQSTGTVLPRTLLIVDEFQVFFAEDDKLSQDAAILLDRLVRQGRAFGIHVLLGSQTLGGTAGLARSTLGQMAVRIALQCSEADSQLILDDTNVAARLLSRPGEAIYNDAGGLVQGNSPFQTAWLPDDRRNVCLERVSALARARQVHRDPPVVFEGNAPADIRQNRILARLLEAPAWPATPVTPRAWLGEAVAIKDPTSVTFKRQSGANLLIVGQRDDAVSAMMAATLLCLGSQHPPHTARFVILGGRPADGRQAGGLHDVAAHLPHETQFVSWRDVPDALATLAAETQRRIQADQIDAPAVYLLVFGLQRYRMLRRQEDDFSFATPEQDKPPAPDQHFAELVREGPPFGIHVVAWADTLATLERTLDRQSLGEFDHRVLFQMSAADSSNLIDAPTANKLGFYRALLYSEEHGLLEKFRPYAALDASWLQFARQCLERKTRQP